MAVMKPGRVNMCEGRRVGCVILNQWRWTEQSASAKPRSWRKRSFRAHKRVGGVYKQQAEDVKKMERVYPSHIVHAKSCARTWLSNKPGRSEDQQPNYTPSRRGSAKCVLYVSRTAQMEGRIEAFVGARWEMVQDGFFSSVGL
jgi:hypothetical protein